MFWAPQFNTYLVKYCFYISLGLLLHHMGGCDDSISHVFNRFGDCNPVVNKYLEI